MKKCFEQPFWIYIFALFSGVAGTMIVLVSVSFSGPGLTHDSAAYMYAAESLLEGKGFQYFGYPSPFIQWPPLLPALLAFFKIFGIGPLLAASIINSIALGLIIFFICLWLFSVLKNKIYAVFGTLLIIFSIPLLQVSVYLWTETGFILFFTLFFTNFFYYFKTNSRKHLLPAAIFAAFACMDRYAGVTLVFTAAIFILFQRKTLKTKILEAFIFGTVSSLPFLSWVIRNYLVSSTLLGVRIPSTYSLKLNIKRTIGSISTWIKPDTLLNNIFTDGILKLFVAFTAIVPVLVMAAFAVFYCKEAIQKRSFFVRTKDQGLIDFRYIAIAFFTLFSMIYLIYLIASATRVLFEPINSRYLVLIYMPVVLAVLSATDILSERLFKSFRVTVTRFIMAAVLLIFMIYPVLNTFMTVKDFNNHGVSGLNSTKWKNNKIIQYIIENPLDGTYYSSNSDAVYVQTGIRTFSLPKKEGPYMYGVEPFKKAIENDKSSYIIWFKSGVPSSIFNMDDIRFIYDLDIIEKNEDGIVYKIVKHFSKEDFTIE